MSPLHLTPATLPHFSEEKVQVHTLVYRVLWDLASCHLEYHLLPISLSVPATSLLFLELYRNFPTSGPLYQLLPIPVMLSP